MKKLIFTTLISLSSLASASVTIQQDVAKDLYTNLSQNTSVTMRSRDHGVGISLTAINVEDIQCETVDSVAVCKLTDSPPNENVTDVQVVGAKAQELQNILNRIQSADGSKLKVSSVYCVLQVSKLDTQNTLLQCQAN